MTFNNLNELMKYIENDVQDVLENEVAETVKDDMLVSIHNDVYAAYSPEHYLRRMVNGGFSDRSNLEATVYDGILKVRDVAPLDNGRKDWELDDIIVHGYGNQPFARDYISRTEERLIDTKDHVEAMKKGLKEKGYNFK